MKKFILISSILVFLILPTYLSAASNSTFILYRTPVAYEKLTVTTGAVVRLTASLRNDANAVFLTFENNNIRYRVDGGSPDANDGHIVLTTQNLYFENVKAIKSLRMIGSGGTSTVIVTYYK